VTYEAVVIGTSAGGLEALQKLLSPLPNTFPLPLVAVQHRLPTADQLLPTLLQESCELVVKEADEKELIKSGVVYIAPANYHLLVERNRTFSLSIDAKVSYSRPSIDVLFETAAETYQSALIGIILTGANNDGTTGFQYIKQCGGTTIAQAPQTARVAMMPRSAIEANVVDHILTLTDMADFLQRLCN